MNKLNSIWQSASEQMYNNTQAQGDTQQAHYTGAETGSKGGDDEVTDVDFEEVDDKK